MSLIQNFFLEAPLQNAVNLYNNEVLPRLTKRNKVIGISAAVAISLVFLIRENVLKPPKKIRHIPYLSFIKVVKSMFANESISDRTYKLNLPKLHSPENKGLYSEYGRSGWIVQVSNPEDAKRVLLKHELFPKAEQEIQYENSLNGKFIDGPNIVLLNGHEWKSQRKVANPAFRRSMPVKLFGKLTQEMFRSMETMNETINVSDLMERWTLDAIGKAGFDFDFHAISDRNNKWVHNYNSIQKGMRDPVFFLFPFLDTKLLWLFPKRRALHKQMDEFLGMLDDVIKNKRETLKKGIQNKALDENERDLLSLMIETEEDGVSMNDAELKSNLCLFFLAGHDTTANALSFAIHYLAQNQDIQRKAREEAIEILGSEPVDVLPTAEETKRMTYINQIMKETLRINGPASRVIPRIAKEDTDLSGTFIPKGTQLTVNIYNIQHDDNYWKDGDKFNPDRFSEDGEATRGAGEGLAWLPFGNGARQCIGMNFSLNEQRVMLSMLLRKFTWETPANSIHKNGVVIQGVGVVGPMDLDITFHKRY
ncbi:unnamed protein product [Mucor hiemalis]